jgi:hypothetical protein
LAFNVGLSIPFGSVAGFTAGGFFGPAGIIGGVVLGSIIGFVVKVICEDRIPTYKVPKYDTAFINTHCFKAARYIEESNENHHADNVYESSLNIRAEIGQERCNNISAPPPKKPKKDGDKNKKNDIQFFEKNIKHIFRNEEGHLLDTNVNRKLLIEMVSNKENFLGIDKFGSEWYAKILSDGKQVWASVRNNIIRNGGLNEFPIIFNNETGLCRRKIL